MATITEDYVSFEVAKLLKEKGFNEPCTHFYESDKKLYNDMGEYFPSDIRNSDHNKESAKGISAPTLQMAMKWLRLERGIAIIPIISSVLDNEKFLWDVEITVAKTNETYNQCWVYEIYEQACETAIKYCLTDLI